MGIIVAYVIILCVYAVCPFLIQIAGFILNAFVPDPIPFLDEFIMILCMFTKIARFMEFIEDVGDFISEHRTVFIIAAIVCVGIVVGIIWYFNR